MYSKDHVEINLFSYDSAATILCSKVDVVRKEFRARELLRRGQAPIQNNTWWKLSDWRSLCPAWARQNSPLELVLVSSIGNFERSFRQQILSSIADSFILVCKCHEHSLFVSFAVWVDVAVRGVVSRKFSPLSRHRGIVEPPDFLWIDDKS